MPGNSQYLEWEFEKLKKKSESFVSSEVNPVTGGIDLSEAPSSHKASVVYVESFGASVDASPEVNTAAFQRALSAGAARVEWNTPGTFFVSDRVLIYSGTTLVLGKKTRIKKVDNSTNNVCILRNENMETGNSDITIIGGVFDGNYANNSVGLVKSDKTSAIAGIQGELSFHKVSGLVIKNTSVTNSNGFAIQISACPGFSAEWIEFGRTYRDGLHINGPCDGFSVNGVSGWTKDDFIAINAWDWRASAPMVGDIKNGFIRNLRANSAVSTGADGTAAIVKFLSGTRDGTIAKVLNITVDGVRGAATGAPAFIASTDTDGITFEPSGAGFVDGVSIKDVKGVRMYNSQPLLRLNQSIGAIDLDLVDGEAIYGLISTGASCSASLVSVNRYVMKSGADRQIVIAGGSIENMSVSNSSFIGFNDGVSPTGNDGGIVVIESGGSVTDVTLDHVRQKFGGSYLFARSTGAAATIRIRTKNCTFQDVKHHIFAEKPVISESVGDVFVNVRSALCRNSGTSSVFSWLGGSATYNGGVPLVNVNAGTLRVKYSDIPVDLSVINTKVNGDQAINSNAALACGAGLSVSNGTSWKNTYTSAVY